MSRTYPVVLIPSYIEYPYLENSPQIPFAPLEKDIFKECLFGSIKGFLAGSLVGVIILLVQLLAHQTPGLAIAIIIASFIALLGGMLGAKSAYQYNVYTLPKEQQKYTNLLLKYQRELELFNLQIPTLQKTVRLKLLKKTRSFDGTNSQAKTGRTEEDFEVYLRQYFNDCIKTKVTVQLYQDYPYTPDFVYIDPQTNLHIDIEIDEPYNYKNKKPIHFLGDSKENIRNEHFLSRSWVIIRFAEEQVRKDPQACCSLINQIVQEITGKTATSGDIPATQLTPLPRWTYNQALEMAENNYRDLNSQ